MQLLSLVLELDLLLVGLQALRIERVLPGDNLGGGLRQLALRAAALALNSAVAGSPSPSGTATRM